MEIKWKWRNIAKITASYFRRVEGILYNDVYVIQFKDYLDQY